jgi:hypothetical protein
MSVAFACSSQWQAEALAYLDDYSGLTWSIETDQHAFYAGLIQHKIPLDEPA